MHDFSSRSNRTDVYGNLWFLLCFSAYGELRIWNYLSWHRLEFCLLAAAADKAGVRGASGGISWRQNQGSREIKYLV